MLVEAACDLCGSPGGDELYASTIDENRTDPALYFSSGRELAGHLRIVRCGRCRLVRSDPRDDEETVTRVYERLADQVYGGEDLNRRRTAAEHLAFVGRHQRPHGRLLDVGCATGIFLEQAASEGWRVDGLEPSEWSLSKARERLSACELYQGTVASVALPAERWDAITLWDVLEHVPSPVATLESVRRWLKPGGWVFLNVPNVESLTARVMGPRWVLLLREHLWFYSPSTIAGLLEKSGFQLVETRTNWVRFSLANIFLRLLQYPGPARLVATGLGRVPGLGKLSLRFPMGEMKVAARLD